MSSVSASTANDQPKGFRRVFSDRKINTKISIGFACVMAITMALSGLSYVGLTRVAENVATLGFHNKSLNVTDEVNFELATFRRLVREYLASQTEARAMQAVSARTRTREAFGRALLTVKVTDPLARLKQARDSFELYGTAFDKLVALQQEQNRLTKRVLDPSGEKLRNSFEELQAVAVKAGNRNLLTLAGEGLKQVMSARLNVNKHLYQNEQAAESAAATAFADLQAVLKAIGDETRGKEESRTFNEIGELVRNYQSGYKSAATIDQGIEELANGEMRKGAEAAAAGVEAVHQAEGKEAHELTREINNLIASSLRFILVLALSGLVLGSLIAWLIGRAISRPIKGMTEAMSALATGNLEVSVPGQSQKDEIGQMAKAVLVFRDAAIDKIRMEREAEEERVHSAELQRRAEEDAINRERTMVSTSIGSGMAKLAMKDLSFRLTDDLPEAYSDLQRDFNNALDQIEAAMQGVRSSTDAITSGTHEISTASDDLSRRTESQAASLEETAAALDEITATVRKTAEGAKQAREVVAEAKTDAETSGNVVRQAVDAMGKIEKSSQEIGNIIGVIDEIAFQTNLLALNAGVEAARAGDAGRGFAVVASEVRALAQRSAEAAKEIKALITASNGEVRQGVKLVAQTGESLERIVSRVTQINGVVGDISASAQEQATALQEVNTAVNQMDQVTQQNAAMAEEATAAGQSLAQESEQLASLVNQFQMRGAGSDAIRNELKKAAPHAFRENGRVQGLAKQAGDPSSPRARAVRQPMKAVANGSGGRRAAAVSGDGDDWKEF